MEKKFYTTDGKKVNGPFSLNELMAMRVTPSTLLYTYELGKWLDANSIPEVANRFSQSNAIPPQHQYPQPPPHPQHKYPHPPPHPQLQNTVQQKHPQAQAQRMPNSVQQPSQQQQIVQQQLAPAQLQHTAEKAQQPEAVKPQVVNPYYIYDEESDMQKGPFLVSELLANGLTPDTQVLCEGMEQWRKAYLVEELQSLFSKDELDKKRHRMFAHPFSYKGRITRTEYWISTAIAYPLLILTIVFALLAFAEKPLLLIPIIMVQLAVLWFWTAQGSKRCHDFSENGYAQFSLLFCLTYYYGKDIFVEDGVSYDNEYGPDPKEFKRHLITEEQSEKRDKLIRIIYYVCITILLVLAISLRIYSKS